MVGTLYNLNPVAPYSLKAPGFNHYAYRSDFLVSNFAFANLTCAATSWMRNIHESVLRTLSAADFAAEIWRRDRYLPTNTIVRLTGLVGAAHLNGREGGGLHTSNAV